MKRLPAYLSAVLPAVLLCTLAPTLAHGQAVTPAPATGDTGTTYPITSLFLPTESAFLRTKVDLGFFFTSASFGPLSLNVIGLGVDAQYVFMDRFEVGLTLPFLQSGLASLGGRSSGDTEFGNLTLKLKGLLMGQNRSKFALSIFANTTLPTGSNLPSRDSAVLQAGVAASANLMPNLTVGGSIGLLWNINGGGSAGQPLGLLIDLFGGYRIMPNFGVQLAAQIGTILNPNSQSPGLALTPAVQYFPTPNWHIDLGVRIATSDNAKAVYTALGTAALMFAAGYQM